MKLPFLLPLLLMCSTAQRNPSQPRCGSVVNNTLTSPGYPNIYPRGVHCVYNVSIPQDKALKMKFQTFDLEYSPICRYDYLKITDDNNVALGKYCGDQLAGKAVVVAGEYAVITFYSDYGVQRSGFLLYTAAVQVPRSVPCGSVVNKTLTSPGYLDDYPLNKNIQCVYNVSISHGKALKLRFQTFDLEFVSNCRHNYLKIADDNNVHVGKYCGVLTGIDVLVPGNFSVITFHSEYRKKKGGFQILFTDVNMPGCGSVVNNSLTSPWYPNYYQNNMHCVYNVPIPQGKALKMKFQTFYLEYESDCGHNYLKITDDNNVQVGQYCGNVTGIEVFVPGDFAVITFHSEYEKEVRKRSKKKGGFQIIFTGVNMPAPCPQGWVSFYGSCYKFSNNKLDWNSAKSACEALGSKLVMLNSGAEIHTVSQINAARAWIGLHRDVKDKSRWLWVDGSHGTFVNWADKEPNGNDDDCVETNFKTLGKWNNLACISSRHYICETSACPQNWIHLQGSCYWLSSSTLDWRAAKFACEGLGSNLTVVNSQAEQQVLGPNAGMNTWIGLHRNPKDNTSWLWIDSSQAIFTYWSQNQPDNWKGIEDCVHMKTGGKWNDLKCSDYLHYACEIFVGPSCLTISPRSGVRVSPSHCLSSKQEYGSTCFFSCALGYQLSGPSSTRCGIGGMWSEDVNTVNCNECQGAVGMEDGTILNGQISASSQLDANHAAIQGRLNSQATSWSAFTSDVDQWLQVDLGNPHSTVTRVATQGGNTHSQWVTNYTLGYSDDGIEFQFYKEQGQNEIKVFDGNTDRDTIVYHELNLPIRARYIRFQPEAWHSHLSMRVELYNCKGQPKVGHWFLDGSDPDVRYFGPVNFTEGWCPGSKAAYFSQIGSYATVPNINITDCDFTIAFWIKFTGFEGPIITISPMSGKLFYVAIKRSIVFLSVYNTLEQSDLKNDDWNHIAVTCEQLKIRVFVNGSERLLQTGERWNEYFFLTSDHGKPDYAIGNGPVLFKVPLIDGPLVGSVMDLHVFGMALPVNHISDMMKGKPTTPVINNREMEINGCSVNLTWSQSKDVCTITKRKIRYREIKSQGYLAEWMEININKHTNNFHDLKLGCDKVYEIAVSSWFGKTQSDWSTSWQVKTNSVKNTTFSQNDTTKIAGITAGIAVALIAGIIVGTVIYRQRQKKKKRVSVMSKTTKSDIIPLLLREVLPERVTIMEELGRGAFGKVHKGVLKELPKAEAFSMPREQRVDTNEGRIVAIKVLIERAGEEGKRQFLQEIDLMKEIGSHKNVLSMLGYWIKSEPIMLIMEYVPHGDLLQWLRYKRQQLTMKNNIDIGVFEELPPSSIENLVADLESSKMTSEDTSKENNTNENVDTVKMEERNVEDEKQGKEGSEDDVSKEGLAEQSEDHEKRNASKQKKQIENSRDGKITSFETNVNGPLNIVPRYSTIGEWKGMQEVDKDAVLNIVAAGEGTIRQFSSLEGAKENDRMDVIIDNEKKEDDEKAKQKGIKRLKDDKAETKNLDVNISTGKKEQQGKNQPVMSTLAVPSTKRGHDSRGKELPIFEPLGATDVKITIEQEEERCDNDDDDRNISSNDLLCFAWQIARGMDYLASRGFVHRDLAARNVLLGEDKTVKIADFGLLRHTSEGEIYEVTNVKKLPIKWTAPEALQSGIFTYKNDVWSFGVVLWELATMGGMPYPGISNRKIQNVLKSGYRMEKPVTCSDEIYTLMLDCWKEDPDERPTFAELISTLEEMMTSDTPYYDFNLVDEKEPYYDDAFPSTSKTVELETHL